MGEGVYDKIITAVIGVLKADAAPKTFDDLQKDDYLKNISRYGLDKALFDAERKDLIKWHDDADGYTLTEKGAKWKK